MTQQELLNLKVGDVILHKANKQKITVADVELQIECVWHDKGTPHKTKLKASEIELLKQQDRH